MSEPDDPPAADDEPALVERPTGFPSTLLALVDRGVPDDGIAYVGLLLERALVELAPWTRTITVFPDVEGNADPTLMQRGLFTARLVRGGRRAACIVFNHVGIATARAGLPAGMRRPYAVFMHGAECWDPALDADRRRALADATLLLANSAHTARRVQEAHPDLPPAEVCPLALLPELDSGAADLALVGSITPRTIVIAGRMNASERHKGHDELLESWPTVLARRSDARLAIVGRGDDVKRLEAKASALGVAGSVRFTGYVSESTLDALLARAGGFALPSRGESSGLGYLRAMRAGVPCIAGDEDAGREVVEHGVTGTIVSPADRDALAQAVIDLLGDTVRRKTMGDAGRERFDAQFSFAAFRDRLAAAVVGRLQLPVHGTG
jgi:phosphatidylinositol alpha-1,6-mannosyltransferase